MPRIVIIGGGIVGTCTAHALASRGAGGDVTVIEPDPTYRLSATLAATGGIRQLFSLPENIEMSRHGLSFLAALARDDGPAGASTDVGFHRIGYLYLGSTAAQVAALEASAAVQAAHGAGVQLLEPRDIARLYPSLTLDDVAIGLLSPQDGVFDPYSLLTALRRRAVGLGVTYRRDRVVDIEVGGAAVRGVRLEGGGRVGCDYAVNAANCWAPEICAMVGLAIPVHPIKRMSYFFECRQALEPMPLTRHIGGGPAFKPEGRGYTTGMVRPGQPPGFDWTEDYELFDERIWPGLAARVSAFEAVRLVRAWPGHYDVNTLDGNAILGAWDGHFDNFLIACGFSGHGLMHAPAVGRAIAELILAGRYETIDLSRFSLDRIRRGEPLIEALEAEMVTLRGEEVV